MKNTFLVLLSFIMIICSTSAFSKTVDGDLQKRNGLYYEPFSPNLANGQYETYYDDGRIRSKENFKDGIEHGLWEQFSWNGQLSFRFTFKNGISHGPYVSYYENGQLSSKYTLKDGEYDGLYEGYLPNGSLYERSFYINGKRFECEGVGC
jgi:antitoxin component YwqK of YwqJK toxin-antitoxin module